MQNSKFDRISVKTFSFIGLICSGLLAGCAGGGFDPATELSFNKVSETTDFSKILSYAQLSNAAYKSPDQIRQQYPNVTRIKSPKGTKTLYFLQVSDAEKLQTIAVRGTDDTKNAFEDAAIRLVHSKKLGIPVHNGFNIVTEAIYKDIKPHLNKNYRVRITGHSLGAAVATMLGLYLATDGYTVESIYNFGQPKFTDAKGVAKYSNFPLVRVVDETDIVPMLPPSGFSETRAYQHIGQEVILLEGKQYIRLDKHDASRISVGQFWRDEKQASINDHHIKNYIKHTASKKNGAEQILYTQWKTR